MNKVMILSSSDATSSFYAKLFQTFGLGKYSKLDNADSDSCGTILWVSSIVNSRINEYKLFLDSWDGLRHKKIVFVLVGKAPLASSIYSHLWNSVVTPAVEERVNFLPFFDQRPVVVNEFAKFCSNIFYFVYFYFKHKELKSFNAVKQCVELLG